MSWWPRSLFGRVALVVCGGLALAHALTFLIILRERGDQGKSMMLAYLGRDVASAVAILDRVPPAERPAWLPRLARQNYRYALGAALPGKPADDNQAEALVHSVVAEIGAARVGRLMQTDSAMVLPLRLADGAPLSLLLTPPHPTVSRTTVLLLLLQFAALALAAWGGVRLAVRPLARLAQAADALKPGAGGPPLDDAGPREVAQAARAFNAMQQRVEGQLTERMQLLAAISHDLQTPITRMKLRADLVSDRALRDKLQLDLDGMQALVEEGLAYARTAQAAQEVPRAVDLHALLDGLVCDATDAGQRVELLGRHDAPLVTRVQALRRVVTNLLDNALKFGGQAQVVVECAGDELHIAVRDRGPGIPPDQLEAVLQPFYRIEGSRNRETGGTGLGLAIAHQLSLALGGRLVLANRQGGGLEAELTLPLRPPV
ncbi:ATP-binding protein [Xylophilus sp. GW821-FHT01B05]